MEYNLLLAARKKKLLFYIGIIALFLILTYTFLYKGLIIFSFVVALLFSVIISPLFFGKNKFFLIFWLFLIPIFDNFRPIVVAGANPGTVLGALITVPCATVFIFNEVCRVWKELPYLRYIILFTIVALLNFFRPDAPLSALTDIFRQFVQIFIIIVAYLYFKKDENSPYLIFKYIGWFTILNSIVAIIQRLFGFGLYVADGIGRVPGLLVHPNVTAFVINLFLPLAIYMFLKSENKKDKKFWGFSIFINTLTLILTFTKIGYLCFAIMAFILILFLPAKIKFRIMLAGILGLISFAVINFAFHLNIIEALVIRYYNNDSVQFRYDMWNLLLSGMNWQNIWVGNGLDSALDFARQHGVNMPAHNVYVELLFEYGFTSIIFHLSFLIPAIEFFKAFINNKSTNRFIYVFPLLILLQIFLNMVTDNPVFSRTPMYISWTVITYFYIKMKSDIESTLTRIPDGSC